MLRSEVNRDIRLGLESRDGTLFGFEGAALDTDRDLRPELWASVIERHQEVVLDHVCGRRRQPLPRGRTAPFRCPNCSRASGFRRRGYRSRQRVLLSRIGRLELRVAQVGCRCGRRFAPILQLLGVAAGARLAPGLARRATELATQMPFAKAAECLAAEAGRAPSVRTIKRLVRDAGRRCDVKAPRDDLRRVPALLVDGTRLPAGPRYGRRPPKARGVELNMAVAVMGRDRSGRRPRTSIELVGATVAEPWSALARAVGACSDAGIAVTDGDSTIDHLLAHATPDVPRQHCTFHVLHNVSHRLWQDGIAYKDRPVLVEHLVGRVLRARTPLASRRAAARSVRLATDHGWSYTAQHLARSGRLLATWRDVERSDRPWRMRGRRRPEHTTSVLERVMREVNRRVDPPGNRWTIEGVRSMTNLVLGRRFDHPAWRRLWHDAGPTRTWAELR